MLARSVNDIASLALAVFGIAFLVPSASAQSTYTGPTCGDVVTTTCPGKPYAASSFTGAFCGNGAATGLTPQAPQLTAEDCAVLCRNQAGFGYRTVDTCACFDDITSFPASPTLGSESCLDNFEVYVHSAEAQASGLARRRAALQRHIRARDTSLCPAPLTACRIEGSSNGYECLDTSSELESCGGCQHGAFTATLDSAASLPFGQKSLSVVGRRGLAPLSLHVDVSAPRGIDCSDRALFGPGMSCREGACVAN